MFKFTYVSKDDVNPIKNQIIKLINMVQKDLKNQKLFTFNYYFIGSEKRNMITCDYSQNVGFDFDINICCNDDEDYFSAKELKDILMKSFNKYSKQFGYSYCEDSSKVFTIKLIDHDNRKIKHSIDFAIVNDYTDEYGNKKQQVVKFDKNENNCIWNNQPDKHYEQYDRVAWIKENNLWLDLREHYLTKKNNNSINKKSCALFTESVNDVCNMYGYFD